MIWDQRGHSQTHGQFFDCEIGAHDGTYKGRLHTAVPYIGPKTLSEDQQEYNDVHGFSLHGGNGGLSAMFGHTLQRSCMAMSVFCSTLLSFVFVDRPRIPPMDLGLMCLSVWAQKEATIEEEKNDDGACCQLCGHRPSDISECGTCHLNMCASCMPLHSCTLQG